MSEFVRQNSWRFETADIFTHTMRFHPEIAEKLMPLDTFSFTILREPSSIFESIYNFYQLNDFHVEEYKESLGQLLETLDVNALKDQSPPLRRKAELIGINQVSCCFQQIIKLKKVC
jgi:Galactose-3-O-sulfotransferase